MRIPEGVPVRFSGRRATRALASMADGSRVQGRLLPARPGAQRYFLFQGEKLPVRVLGDVGAGHEFILYKSGTGFVLRALRGEGVPGVLDGFGAQLPQGADRTLLETAARFLLQSGVPLDDNLISRMVRLLAQGEESTALLRMLYLLFNPGREAGLDRLLALWRKRPRQAIQEKSAGADILKEGEFPGLQDMDLQVVRAVLEQLASDPDRHHSLPHREAGQGRVAFLFYLLPMALPGTDQLLPLLYLGPSVAVRKAWLFSQLELSRLGETGIALSQQERHIQATLFCAAEHVPYMRKAMQGIRVTHTVRKWGDQERDFMRWPFSYLVGQRGTGVDRRV